MAATILLDPVTNDVLIDANGNIAVAVEPYAILQDVITCLRTWRDDCFFDLDYGIDYEALMNSPQLLKAKLEQQALGVIGVQTAEVTSMVHDTKNRILNIEILINGQDTIIV